MNVARFAAALLALLLAAPAGPASAPAPEPAAAPAAAAPAAVPDPALLACLGARFTLVPEPENGRLRLFPLGLFLPETGGPVFTLETPGAKLAFPDTAGLPPGARQRVDPTGIAYELPVAGTPLVLAWEARAPCSPRRDEWRSAPYFLIRIRVIHSGVAACPVRLAAALEPGRPGRAETSGAIASLAREWQCDLAAAGAEPARLELAPHLQPVGPLAESAPPPGAGGRARIELRLGGPAGDWRIEDGALAATVTLGPGQTLERDLVLCGVAGDPVLEVDGRGRRFYYTRNFRDSPALLAAALARRDELRRRDAQFRATLLLEDAPPALVKLTCLGLQSFLANTWLVDDPVQRWRYSEWEGYPRFHSTLDVVYNTSPFYLLAAPDLLRDLLLHWPRYGRDGHLPHDFGKDLTIGACRYPVPMTVEEDANFLLLHFLYWNFSGDAGLAQVQAPLLRLVALNLAASDEDGDGLPDRGVVNTFDDAPPSVSAARNQLYLGVKTAAALTAFLALPPAPGAAPEPVAAALARSRAAIANSWLGDHYPISLASALPTSRRGVLLPVQPGTSGPFHSGGPDGPDGYSNYLAHGLVPLLWAGERELAAAAVPHAAAHLEAASRATATRFGDAHREGQQNVWASQNLWRDAAGRLLGARLDYDGLLERAWELQLEARRRRAETPSWLGFCDSPVNASLSALSRGAAVLLLPWAARGVTYSAARARLTVPPAGGPSRLALPFLADWASGRMPVLIWDRAGPLPDRIENEDLLRGARLEPT